MNFELTDKPAMADVDYLGAGLDAHGAAIVPPRKKRDIGVFVRDENGRVLAGMAGVTYWNWLHIKLLWVDDSLRGQGIGRRLMQMAEVEAVERGCHSAMVDTHSFQAEEFYVALGYEVFGRLQDFPMGHQRIYLQKSLP